MIDRNIGNTIVGALFHRRGNIGSTTSGAQKILAGTHRHILGRTYGNTRRTNNTFVPAYNLGMQHDILMDAYTTQ